MYIQKQPETEEEQTQLNELMASVNDVMPENTYLVWSLEDNVFEFLPMTEEEIAERNGAAVGHIRAVRDQKIKDFEWRIERYNSQIRQGITPTDDIAVIDTYIQALRDITDQSDLVNAEWPVDPYAPTE